VAFGPTEQGVGGYQDGSQIVMSNDWAQRHFTGKEDLAGTLAHELQHMLDTKAGLKPRDYDGMEQVMNDPQALERFLEGRIATRVASEVRAYERRDAIIQGKPYVDDGVTSAAEVKAVLSDMGYADVYNRQLNSDPQFSERYTVNYWQDSHGAIRVTVTPKPPVGDFDVGRANA
jgi:hypothetical protein